MNLRDVNDDELVEELNRRKRVKKRFLLQKSMTLIGV